MPACPRRAVAPSRPAWHSSCQPQVTPPQSTIASLGPAGQPQMQAPRNPLLEMARDDPRAAMMLQQQIEGRAGRGHEAPGAALKRLS